MKIRTLDSTTDATDFNLDNLVPDTIIYTLLLLFAIINLYKFLLK